MTDVISITDHIKLRDMLAQLYLDKPSAQRIASDAGMNLALLRFSDNAANNWEEITRMAAAWDRLVPLIEKALSEFPTNTVLKEVLSVVQAGERKPPPPASISDVQLRDFIIEHFKKGDVDDMLLNLSEELRQAGKITTSASIDIDSFSSTSAPISSVAREMVQYFRHRTWTSYLLAAVQAARPDAFRDKFGQ